MQFDFFDRKIKEAADHHHPAYDEQAWRKMRKLLDRHMPEEEKKRRFLFLVPLFLLLAGGVWFFALRMPGSTKQSLVKESQPPATGNKPSISVAPIVQPPGEAEEDFVEEPTTSPTNLIPENERMVSPTSGKTQRDPSSRNITNKSRQNENVPVKENDGENTGKDEEKVQPTVSKVANQITAINNEPPVAARNDVQTEQPEKTSGIAGREESKPEEVEKTSSEPAIKRKKKPSLASKFFFYGTAGPDISFTSSIGKVRMVGGLGAGFNINDRITVRSGFFSARKVYSAKPDDYDPPSAFWNYYPNMQKIDASCKVYEIPLLVTYQFRKSSKGNLMATAGLSSYLMKEEKYRYFYKYTPSSPTITRDYTVRNRFEHHFSVLTLSGGYKRNFGKKLSVMAEPYVKLPLQGVGFGKVKLNSGGVMVSVGFRPFAD